LKTPRPESTLTLPGALLVLLGALTTGRAVGNGYVFDDASLIANNGPLHSLANLPSFFLQPYWPAPYPPALYRPLTTSWLALQWAVADGHPAVYRIVSIALYLGVTVGLFAWLTRYVSRLAAWAIAALFVVTPVHVEAVAQGVNQAELIVAGLGLVMLSIYLPARASERMPRRSVVTLTLLFLVAILFKETGAVLALVLVGAELLLVKDHRPLGRRLRPIGVLFSLFVAVVVLTALVRAQVFHGDVVATPVAETLRGLTLSERALTMLGVVPEWARLLLWPAHLRVEYSPSEMLPASSWGGPQTVGLLLVTGSVLVLAHCWRRCPLIAFGLLVLGFGLAPVSNVLTPTGVLLAERTLFLPSVGLAIAAAGMAQALRQRIEPGRWARPILVAALGVVLVLGAGRSIGRFAVWRSEMSLWQQAVVDAPRSARAHHGLAQLLFREGRLPESEREYQLAVKWATKDWAPAFDYANRLRSFGRCEQAAPLYRITITLESKHEGARASLIECLLATGDVDGARREAEAALAAASSDATAAVFRRLLDKSITQGGAGGASTGRPR